MIVMMKNVAPKHTDRTPPLVTTFSAPKEFTAEMVVASVVDAWSYHSTEPPVEISCEDEWIRNQLAEHFQVDPGAVHADKININS